MKSFNFFLMTLMLLSACNDSKLTLNELRGYFYPIQKFQKPTIYKYVEKENSDNIKYLLMKSYVLEGDTILITETYDGNFYLLESSKERINPRGSELYEFNIYKDSSTINTTIIANSIFVWNLPKDSIIRTSISYDYNNSLHTFNRSRTLVNRSGSLNFQNSVVKCIEYKDEFTFVTQQNEKIETFNFTQKTYYSFGYGMLEYERIYLNGKHQHFYLEQIIQEEDWLQMLANGY